MNKCVVIGRLVADPEAKYIGETAVSNFRIAVNRDFKNKDGNYDADFFSVSAFGKTAEMVTKYLTKGRQIAIEARLQSRTYEAQDGSKRNVVELVAQHIEFLGSKQDGAQNFTDVTDDVNDELPF